MRIAAQKYQDNIAEYVLYMWHLEDVVRACEFNMDIIRPNLIVPQSDNEAIAIEVEEWYENLLSNLKSENKLEKGHLNEVNEVVVEILYLHNMLLNISNDKAYEQIYTKADPFIKEFANKANNNSLNPVEICLQGQYSKLLLKLQKKEISPETESAFDSFREVLAYLSDKYRQMKNGTYPVMNN